MSAGSTTSGPRLGGTMRRDAWWLELLPVVVLLGAFGIYATLRAFEGNYYDWGPYLSPFYSPLIDPHHRWWPFSPALLILIWPLGFRVTCYYYRKAYYRAFFLDPPACAVSEGGAGGKHRYRGETGFPFILQNLHRYFLYVGFLFLLFLWRDAFRAFVFDGRIGVGVGTLVLLFNVILLTTYALSCHSLRHIVGGKLDCFSCTASARPRHTAWRWLTVLNERHMPRKCIECFLCQNVWHVLRDHEQLEHFGGPRFFVRVAALEMHPLDSKSRAQVLKDDLGISLCNITKCCTEVCPEDIHITDNAIIPLEERVVDEFYDPVLMLVRKIRGAKPAGTKQKGKESP